MAKKHRIKIATLKYNALKLRANKQIPLYLAYLINQLDGSEDTRYMRFLIEMSQHMMRVKNYYKLYPLAEKESEEIIKNGLVELGYSVIDVHA